VYSQTASPASTCIRRSSVLTYQVLRELYTRSNLFPELYDNFQQQSYTRLTQISGPSVLWVIQQSRAGPPRTAQTRRRQPMPNTTSRGRQNGSLGRGSVASPSRREKPQKIASSRRGEIHLVRLDPTDLTLPGRLLSFYQSYDRPAQGVELSRLS